jgi:hypothetical protein
VKLSLSFCWTARAPYGTVLSIGTLAAAVSILGAVRFFAFGTVMSIGTFLRGLAFFGLGMGLILLFLFNGLFYSTG